MHPARSARLLGRHRGLRLERPRLLLCARPALVHPGLHPSPGHPGKGAGSVLMLMLRSGISMSTSSFSSLDNAIYIYDEYGVRQLIEISTLPTTYRTHTVDVMIPVNKQYLL